MDDALNEKIKLMISRVTHKTNKKDTLLLIEGGEGEGKTNLAFQVAYKVKYETGREFTTKNVFYSAEKLVEFAQNTKEQIIVYDEPALDMMGGEWWKQEQMNLVKLLMMARKNRHFFIFNITKFYKFSEYVVVDRSIGLIHVYSRNEIEPGHFVYIKKKQIEYLFNSYKGSKKRDYKKFSSLRGTFPDYVPGIIDYEQYEKDKDEAILSIGKGKRNKYKDEVHEIKYKLGKLKLPIQTKEEFANALGLSKSTLSMWVERYENTQKTAVH
jgi:DNA-binding XRE family transcriptional regulator